MHAALYTLLGLALLTNLVCLIGIFWVKGVYRDSRKVVPVAKWVELLGITMVAHLVLLLALLIFALELKAVGIAAIFLAFLISPFAIGFAADDYHKADRYIAVQLFAFVISLVTIPIAFHWLVLMKGF